MKINEFVHTLQQSLEKENINFGNEADSILGLLCDAYYDRNCSYESDEIKQTYDELYEVMNENTICEMDRIISLVCSLCRAHQRSGFTDGIKVGLLLSQELSDN